jgi:hypothetical protein
MLFIAEIHVFLEKHKIGLFGTKEALCNMRTLVCRKYSSKKPTQLSRETMC